MDVVISTSILGLLGGLIAVFTFLGNIPPWLGYSVGGALLSIYAIIMIAGLRAPRDKRSPLDIIGKRGVVAGVENGWAIVKIEGVYWRAYCIGCLPGDVVEVVEVGDTGLVVKKT